MSKVKKIKKYKAKIKKGDKVMVVTGADKGSVAEVLLVMHAENKVLVANTNMAIKHVKPSNTEPGSRNKKALPIAISNVALVDSKGVKTKVGIKSEDGKRVRYAKTTGEIL